jgi:uncharacterized glyoxalase superfamily protein PhnB
MVNPIPEGTHTVTPHLIVRGGDRAIEFYKQAFGAVEVVRHLAPDGSIMHGELRIGDSPVYLAEENAAWGSLSPLALGGSPVTIHLFVPDVDASFERAIQAGGSVRMPLSDAFWGDRYGQLGDPFGHVWSIATHKEDVSPEELERRLREAFASMPPPEPEPEPASQAAAADPPGREVPRRSAPRPAPRRRPAKKKAVKKAAKKAKKKVAKKKAAGKRTTKKKVARKAGRKGSKKVAKKKVARKKVARKKVAKAGRKKRAKKPARKKVARKAPGRKGRKKPAGRKKAARRRGAKK